MVWSFTSKSCKIERPLNFIRLTWNLVQIVSMSSGAGATFRSNEFLTFCKSHVLVDQSIPQCAYIAIFCANIIFIVGTWYTMVYHCIIAECWWSCSFEILISLLVFIEVIIGYISSLHHSTVVGYTKQHTFFRRARKTDGDLLSPPELHCAC